MDERGSRRQREHAWRAGCAAGAVGVAVLLLIACTGAPPVPDPAEPVPPAVLTQWAQAATMTAAPATIVPAASPGATGTPVDAWAGLRARPVRLPSVAPGSPCPVTPAQAVSPAFPAALGSGPVYPVGFGAGSVLYYGSSAFPPPWRGQKVLWIADPGVRGPVLVRGQQLDGPNELRFADGADPPAELRLDPAESSGALSGWNNWPTYTRVRAPGCYGYQVDGLTFTAVIIFEASDALAPP